MDQFDYNQPNTRERMAARRRTRAPRNGPMVIPGPRRAVSVWFASGRIFSLLLLIAALGGLFYIAGAPRFTVRDIRVEGAQALSARDIVALVGARDQSIWQVDTQQIVERLQTNAYIEHADASVTLPDQLTITVDERRPELHWRSGGVLYLLDGDGRVLSTAESVPLTNTLVIEDRGNQPLQPNDQVDATALRLGRVLALRLPAELHLAPASIGWDGNNGMVVATADGRTIIFGRNDDFDDKFDILRTLIADGTPFTLLDLRPNTPFYRNDVPNKPAPAEPTPTN
jgi:cell division protein FtsQ